MFNRYVGEESRVSEEFVGMMFAGWDAIGRFDGSDSMYQAHGDYMAFLYGKGQ